MTSPFARNVFPKPKTPMSKSDPFIQTILYSIALGQFIVDKNIPFNIIFWTLTWLFTFAFPFVIYFPNAQTPIFYISFGWQKPSFILLKIAFFSKRFCISKSYVSSFEFIVFLYFNSNPPHKCNSYSICCI